LEGWEFGRIEGREKTYSGNPFGSVLVKQMERNEHEYFK